jgi:hypothetical protein
VVSGIARKRVKINPELIYCDDYSEIKHQIQVGIRFAHIPLVNLGKKRESGIGYIIIIKT